MNDFINEVKNLLLLLLTTIASLLSPIEGALCVLIIAASFNFLLGLGADIHANKKEFSLKKAFEAVSQLVFYGLLVFLISYAFGQFNDEKAAGIGVKWITYVVTYFYITNTLRNATMLWPKNKTIEFLYMIASTKLFEKLKEYLGVKK